MTNYIVDCRYIRTTTQVGVPDFTIEVEAECPEDAMRIAARSHAWDDFVAVGACDALGLVKILREQVRTLADFAREAALKSSTADDDIAKLEALCLIHGITLPTYDEDDEAGIAKARQAIEAEELEAEDHLYDIRRKKAKDAFEHYDFTAYGGVDTICGWYGVGDEEHMLLRLGGSFVADHVLAVEFEPFSGRIVHVCVQPFDLALAPSDVMSAS